MGVSLLATDGYKFSMAEAGWPLRREVFYYSHRKGGFQVMPVDADAFVRAHLPEPVPEDYEYLSGFDYEMGGAFKAAIRRFDRLQIRSVPQGAWFFDREPAFTVAGPSALVSWLEPLVLMLNFRIQVATAALTDREAAARALSVATCEDHKRIILETLDWAKVDAFEVEVDEAGYHARVLATARELVEIVGDGNRIFEVGMRAAACMRQHEIALSACKDAGITRTSNVFLARKLSMVPVGTMGHEHIQRYGNDRAAFQAMRDRRPVRASFLLDTFDTLRSGIPTAFDLIRTDPVAGDSIRYDSGDKVSQYRFAVQRARELGINPVHILEDGFDAHMTREFEALRTETGLKPDEQLYGYGGFLVARPSQCPLTRDRVSAVWKLAQTGVVPTMKFGDEAGSGKESIPGEPVVFRRTGSSGSVGIVGQAGEKVPDGYALLTGGLAEASGRATCEATAPADRKLVYSPRTQALVNELRQQRGAQLANF